MIRPELLSVDPECETIMLAVLALECAGRAHTRPGQNSALDTDWRDFCKRHLTACKQCQEYRSKCP